MDKRDTIEYWKGCYERADDLMSKLLILGKIKQLENQTKEY